MGPWGAIVMGFFGGVFFAAAAIKAEGWHSLLLLIPVFVFVAVAAVAARLIGRAAPGAYDTGAKAGKIIARASIAEGAGITLVALTLANIGRNDLVLPGIAVIVGLHFLPMAYAIPFRAFYIIAALLLAAAAVGFVLRQPEGSIVTGLAGALILWAASVLALRRPPAFRA
jgi:hypothetical protein